MLLYRILFSNFEFCNLFNRNYVCLFRYMLWAWALTFCWLGWLYNILFLGESWGTLVENSNFVYTRIHIFYEFLWDNHQENVSKRWQNKYSYTSGNSDLGNLRKLNTFNIIENMKRKSLKVIGKIPEIVLCMQNQSICTHI